MDQMQSGGWGKSAAGAVGLGNGFRLFRAFGIDVLLHWSWFIVAYYEVERRKGEYGSLAWNVLEVLTLFGIVLMHEFGHALACRSVGGRAERILLWPFGGIAFVQPPPRAAALLWSIVAGPLVNVVLIPVFYLLSVAVPANGSDLGKYLDIVFAINVGILLFNVLPVYPLDGGQILQSLLWFVIGRGRSLMVAGVIGVVGAGGLGAWAVVDRNWWLAVMAALGVMQAWKGVQFGLSLRKVETIPRRQGLQCPACGKAPPALPVWTCSCGNPTDPFADPACPRCGAVAVGASCPDCGRGGPKYAWYPTGLQPMNPMAGAMVPPPPPPGPVPAMPRSIV